jgi:predicted nuclease of predicted toxin-antitoxin system
VKFLANENFPLRSTALLRAGGYDVSSIGEDSPGIEDSDVLSRSVAEERVILTFDRDYGELIYRLQLPVPRGLIYFRFRPHHAMEPAEILLNLLKSPELTIEARFTVVERDQLRQRPLP